MGFSTSDQDLDLTRLRYCQGTIDVQTLILDEQSIARRIFDILQFLVDAGRNVQYLANSENYLYRFESEKPALWVKMRWGQKQIDLNLIHPFITKSSLILASGSSWRSSIIDNILNFQEPTF